MHAIDLCDEVIVSPSESPTLTMEWADDAPRRTQIDWPTANDLAFRARAALERAIGRSLPAAMRIIKRIPVGSGLGGGSSDAAATLLALRDAFDLDLDTEALAAIGAALGSDVAFFIDDDSPPRPAIVTEFGKVDARVEPSEADLLLILPPVSCETRAVYAEFDRHPSAAIDADRVRALAGRGGAMDPRELFNDLEAAAHRLHPVLAEIQRRAREATGEPVHLTGSGSAMFIVCESEAQRDAVRAGLARAIPNCAIVPARLASA